MTLHCPVCPCLREQRYQRASLTVGKGGHVDVFDGYSKLLSEKTIKNHAQERGCFSYNFVVVRKY